MRSTASRSACWSSVKSNFMSPSGCRLWLARQVEQMTGDEVELDLRGAACDACRRRPAIGRGEERIAVLHQHVHQLVRQQVGELPIGKHQRVPGNAGVGSLGTSLDPIGDHLEAKVTSRIDRCLYA